MNQTNKYEFKLLDLQSTTGAYQPPPDRPFVVRSYIKAVVPIEISDLSGSLTRSTQIISKIVIKEALIEGAKRKIFEPLVEDEF